jgi:fatty acid desaturase
MHPATAVALIAVLGAQLFAAFGLPLVLASRGPAWGLLLIPLALTHHTLWSLVHEAIHGTMATPRRANDGLGRLLAALHGAPFAVLRLGHLLHHRHNRTALDVAEAYDPARTSRPAAVIRYFVRLLGGLYLAEVAAGLLLLMPHVAAERAARALARADPMVRLMAPHLLAPGTLWATRIDALAALALWTAAAWCWGAHAWMLLAFLGLRAVAISLTDNLHHYGTPVGDRHFATNLCAPPWLAALLLDFQYHGVHHRHPSLPWHRLATQWTAEGGATHGRWFQALLRQLRGPIARPPV